MKKGLKIFGLTVGALLVLILVAALIIPFAFKDKIRAKLETQISSTVNAEVKFADYKLSLFRAFPNIAFSVSDLSITGVGSFQGDTLAFVKSLDLVFNLKSLFSEAGYEMKSVTIDRPQVHATVLKDGAANWDIMKETEVETEAEVPSSFRLALNKILILEGRIVYTDLESDMSAVLNGLDALISGDMTASRTDLVTDITVKSVSFLMDKVKYLSGATASLKGNIDTQTDSLIFRFADNQLNINDLGVNFSGLVAMPAEDITTDLIFETREASFKSLLSLIPAVYMSGYEKLQASGNFSLNGTVKGVYSSVDSTMPDVSFRLLVSDGAVSYPDLPETITAIAIDADVAMDGTDMDKTIVGVNRFHFVLAGNPFDMTMNLRTPLSDPDINARAVGKIDLAKLKNALPLDSISLTGLFDVSLNLAGRLSMIENKKYDQFKADGTLGITGMAVEMADLPAIRIDNASMTFNPAYSELKQLMMKVGEKSDFRLSGRLENYIPWLLSDGIIKGNLSLFSSVVDLNEIMDKIPSDTTAVKDTTALAVINIPRNIDFVFIGEIGRLFFDRLEATEVKGNLTVRDGAVTVRETGMKALGGTIVMNADYDTRDTLKPSLKADMKITSVGIKDAFSAFNTVQKLAPAAQGLGGKLSAGFRYESLLGNDFMPVLASITGGGTVSSEMVQVLESKAFDQIKGVLKINPEYTNTLKDVSAAFTISKGRVFVKPFDTKLGNIKMNISGDQGLDQTINYLVKTEIPRSDLGESVNALIGTLSAQAALLGLKYVPSDIIKVNLKVGGTFRKPVITPSFTGGDAASPVTTVTEAIKEQAVEMVNETAREQADKILKEAEEKAKYMRDEASSAAKTIRSEADQRGQKLIKDAESKGPIAVLAAKKGAEALNREAEKRATQLETEANAKADRLMAEAKTRADEILK